MTSSPFSEYFQPLQTDFIALRANPWPLVFLSLLLTLVVAIAAFRYTQLLEQEAAILKAIEDRQRQISAESAAARSQATNPARAAEEKARNEAAMALAYPWKTVFEELEDAADTPGVALLSMTHDRADGRTVLTLEAADVRNVVDYLRRLERFEGRTREWRLLGYQVQQKGNPQTVRAQIEGVSIASKRRTE